MQLLLHLHLEKYKHLFSCVRMAKIISGLARKIMCTVPIWLSVKSRFRHVIFYDFSQCTCGFPSVRSSCNPSPLRGVHSVFVNVPHLAGRSSSIADMAVDGISMRQIADGALRVITAIKIATHCVQTCNISGANSRVERARARALRYIPRSVFSNYLIYSSPFIKTETNIRFPSAASKKEQNVLPQFVTD